MKKLNLFAVTLFTTALNCGAADIVTFEKANKINPPVSGDTVRYVFVEKANLAPTAGSMYQICDCSDVKINEDGTVSFAMSKVNTLRIHSNIDKKAFFGKKPA
ncbi:MAG: hypothetical protein L6W00_17925 [Lentisphaeria bacterium]|nr:MAG: hypothetical protein L6W00_17925 [Lentisphaeria bacterium]